MEANRFNRGESIEVESGIYIDITDVGEGIPIVLIHGWPLNKDMFEYQVQFLVKKGYRVITPSLRGYGRSSKPFSAYSYDEFAKDIHQVIKKLDLHDFIIGGFSMGAAVALYYAAHYGQDAVRQLWMIGAAAPLYTQRQDFLFDGPTYESVNDNIVFLNQNRPELVDGVLKALWSPLSKIPDTFRLWLFSLGMQASLYATEQSMIALRDSDLREEMKLVKVPVKIFHGKQDIISPFILAETMQKGFLDAELIAFENSGHAVLWEEQELFNQSLLKVLK